MGSKKEFCTFEHFGNGEAGMVKSDCLLENFFLNLQEIV